MLQDGQTIVIGGLLKDRVSKVTLKTPFLGDIPILGWLFRRETLQTEKVDLLIFLTASSVPAEGSVLVLTNVNSLARGPALVSPSSAVLTDASVVTPADLKSAAPEAPAEAATPAVNQPAVVPVVVNTPESEPEPEPVPVVVGTPPASAPAEQALPTPVPEPPAVPTPAPAPAPEVFSPESLPQPGLQDPPSSSHEATAESAG